MALVVEDGTGKTDAESYISVADSNTYHTAHGHTAWTGSETVKEQALRAATQYLDATFQLQWKGRSVTKEQALDWPRSGATLQDGWNIDSDEIPASLQHATTELALHALTEELIPDIDDPGVITSHAVKVGPISEQFDYNSRSQEKFFRLASNLIRDLIEPGSRIVLGIT